MTKPLVTILIPNYKTPDLTKLCLRLLRKHTDPKLIHTIVIDNNSADDSLEYLRRLEWIELIERQSVHGESPPLSHARALDLGLNRATTPYVLSIHTDTLVKHPDWLPFLLAKITHQPIVAGVGSWKLESKTWLRRQLKLLENKLQFLYYKLNNRTEHTLEGVGKNYYYLRSHCALYRMDLIRNLNLSFADGEETAGKAMHKKLIDNNYKMVFLSSEILGQYVDHINHATMILNPQLGVGLKPNPKDYARVMQRLKAVDAEAILQDKRLDK